MSALPRPMPTHLLLEQKILGVMLRVGEQEHVEGDPVDVVTRVLEPVHFADPVHGAIYAEALRRIEANEPYGASALAQTMGPAGVLDEVGGSAYLAQLQAQLEDFEPLGAMAGRIVHAWRGREAVVAAEDIINRAAAVLDFTYRTGGLGLPRLAVLQQCAVAMKAADAEIDDDVQIVDGSVVDMLPPWAATDENRLGGHRPNWHRSYFAPGRVGDMPLESDLYGESMLMKTTLDREEVLVLSEFHQTMQKRGLILVRVAERDHHQKRLNHFSDALLELDPMDPPKPRTGKMDWDR